MRIKIVNPNTTASFTRLCPSAGRAVAALGVPVIEGVAAAVKLVETLLSLHLSTSKRGAWGFPPVKPMSEAAATFALEKSTR
jgi:Asp/Glu/hydantoin racemase